jgi:hypothetical protein
VTKACSATVSAPISHHQTHEVTSSAAAVMQDSVGASPFVFRSRCATGVRECCRHLACSKQMQVTCPLHEHPIMPATRVRQRVVQHSRLWNRRCARLISRLNSAYSASSKTQTSSPAVSRIKHMRYIELNMFLSVRAWTVPHNSITVVDTENRGVRRSYEVVAVSLAM